MKKCYALQKLLGIMSLKMEIWVCFRLKYKIKSSQELKNWREFKNMFLMNLKLIR